MMSHKIDYVEYGVLGGWALNFLSAKLAIHGKTEGPDSLSLAPLLVLLARIHDELGETLNFLSSLDGGALNFLSVLEVYARQR